jgi:hypothetical protein
LILNSLSLYAQDSSQIRSIIKNDLRLIDEIFKDRIFINLASQIDTSNVCINSIRYLNNSYKDFSNHSCEIIVVNISFINLIPLRKQNIKIDSLKFEYIIVKVNSDYYKLFGFLTTDINLLRKNIFIESKYKSFIKWVAKNLEYNKFLTARESKKFTKSIFKNYLYYNKRINRSVNVLNQIFPDRIYQTIIIDYDWIKPMII